VTDTDNRRTIAGRIHETFSQAFQNLVKNDGDIVGMIAYCLYKQQKGIHRTSRKTSPDHRQKKPAR
jgi:hypothetical protein